MAEERRVLRIGAVKARAINVRFLAATNRNLEAEIARGRFREDLYYRIHVVPIELPPLSARREDVADLVAYFLEIVCVANGRKLKRIASDAVTLLMQYDWPGNVRELKNVVERLVRITSYNVCYTKLLRS